MYRKVKREEIPKRGRKSESLFAVTPEWRHMRADLDGGLKKDESCYLQFCPKDWTRIGLEGKPMPGRNVASGCYAIQRFIKGYLQAANRKYTVRVLHSGDHDFVIVDGPKA